MAAKNIVLPILLSSFDTLTLDVPFQLITAGLPASCTILRFINNSDRDITISYDGVTAHEFLPLESELTLNFQSNSQPSGLVSCMPARTKIYASGLTLGTGFLYLAGYYNPEGI